MKRTKDPFESKLDTGFGGGGKSQIGGAPSSSLQGSRWGAKGLRPTEPPKSKTDLRAAQRQAKQPEIDRAQEAARASLREERKKKFGITGFKKGGMVKGQNRDYCK